jgi:hypothetical protein
MTKRFTIIIALIVTLFGNINAQTTVNALSEDISYDLDLQAVASVFGESEDLEDFEYKLNDPNLQISNLDLNQDGYVDYLRVVDISNDNTIVIVIQAVVGQDLYQDVATVEVEKNNSDNTYVQVVGDEYIYGPEYYITPVYATTPIIFDWFWGSLFRPWHSPFYWGYYPSYYHPWRPMSPYRYRNHVNGHINAHNSYHYTSTRMSRNASSMHSQMRRNDYATKHANQSFSQRNSGIKNSRSLNQNSRTQQTRTKQYTRPVQSNQNTRTTNNHTTQRQTSTTNRQTQSRQVSGQTSTRSSSQNRSTTNQNTRTRTQTQSNYNKSSSANTTRKSSSASSRSGKSVKSSKTQRKSSGTRSSSRSGSQRKSSNSRSGRR